MRSISNLQARLMNALDIPMRGNLPKPLDAGVFHRTVRVETLGDGAGDEGGALFQKQFDQPFLLPYQRIDLRRLSVEECRDGELFGKRWKRHNQARITFSTHILDGCLNKRRRQPLPVARRSREV